MPKSSDFHHAAGGPLILITAWEALLDQAHQHIQQGHFTAS